MGKEEYWDKKRKSFLATKQHNGHIEYVLWNVQ